MPPEALTLLARRGEPACAGPRLLYLDTETTGLAGGTGTYAFLVGAGDFDGDVFEVRQYFMRDLDQEPALIAALEGLLGRFDGLVIYNGNGFDLPLLETRFVLARRPGGATPRTLICSARPGGSGAPGSPTAGSARWRSASFPSSATTTCPGP